MEESDRDEKMSETVRDERVSLCKLRPDRNTSWLPNWTPHANIHANIAQAYVEFCRPTILHDHNGNSYRHEHRRRLKGKPGMCPPIIENRSCIYHFLPPFAPPIFWFVHPIFLTSLRQWARVL